MCQAVCNPPAKPNKITGAFYKHVKTKACLHSSQEASVAETNTRQASRAPVTLKIKFKSETLDQFIERYSVDISHGGIFIRTKDPLAVGTTLKFEFQLKDATPLIGGEGTVVWTREHDPTRTGVSPGMGVRFDKLPSESQKVLDQVLAKKDGSVEAIEENIDEEIEDEGEGFGDDFVDTPTRVAPAALVDSLTNSQFEEGDMTPLPKPMPFHGDLNDFSDEAFSESTRVASLDSILAQAKSAEQDQDDSDYDDQVFASTSAPPPPAPAPAPALEPSASADNYEDPFADLNDDDEEDASDRAATVALENDGGENDGGETGGDTDEDAPAPAQEAEPLPPIAVAPEPEEAADEPSTSTRTAAATDAPKAAVAAAASEPESSSSMPWIAVAAVILLIGGVGGFWLLNNGDGKKKEAATAVTPSVALDAKVDENGIKDPVKDPASNEPTTPTVEVAVTTVPVGATLTVEGTEITATSPATLELPEGKTSVIVVTHGEFLSQSIEVVADGTEVGPITLVAMPRLLRFTSTPSGARVFVNGQKLPGVTPLDFPFNSRIARRPTMSVQYRLPRHKMWSANLPTKDGFVAVEKTLVRTIDGALEFLGKRPAQSNTPRVPKDDTGPDDTGPDDEPSVVPEGGTPKDDDPKVAPKIDAPKVSAPKVVPPKVDAIKKDPPKSEPPKDETSGGEPTPDWMK
tara:strand:+ start:63123 stop:65189 length:2067 start_codon:yes stop_codon:yes gene_type:complete